MKALIVADGDVVPSDARALGPDVDGRPLIVAADGGANKAALLGLVPDVVVGDMDSLSDAALQQLERDGVEVQHHPAAKDQSDTELALHEALRRGADELVILGALGGLRFEHTLANVLLLTLPQLAGRDAVLVQGPVTVRAMGIGGPARLALRGRPGDLLSLLPLSEEVCGVTTAGLGYPLQSETLRQGPARGVSNVFIGTEAAITTETGRLAVVHTSSDGGGADD